MDEMEQDVTEPLTETPSKKAVKSQPPLPTSPSTPNFFPGNPIAQQDVAASVNTLPTVDSPFKGIQSDTPHSDTNISSILWNQYDSKEDRSRYRFLLHSLERSIHAMVQPINAEHFRGCLSTMVRDEPTIADQLATKLSNFVKEKATLECLQILNTFDARKKLNELDEMIQEGIHKGRRFPKNSEEMVVDPKKTDWSIRQTVLQEELKELQQTCETMETNLLHDKQSYLTKYHRLHELIQIIQAKKSQTENVRKQKIAIFVVSVLRGGGLKGLFQMDPP
jgi:hypothetical protein